jgi:hypothetical protein
LDGVAIRHVADLVLAVQLGCERTEPFLPSSDEDASPPAV